MLPNQETELNETLLLIRKESRANRSWLTAVAAVLIGTGLLTVVLFAAVKFA